MGHGGPHARQHPGAHSRPRAEGKEQITRTRARLLAAGHSNQEIATILTLSPRTVERHLATIYGKTGSRGRVDATNFARRHGLV